MDGGGEERGRREDGAESSRDGGIGNPRATENPEKEFNSHPILPPLGGRLRFPSLGVGFVYKGGGGVIPHIRPDALRSCQGTLSPPPPVPSPPLTKQNI